MIQERKLGVNDEEARDNIFNRSGQMGVLVIHIDGELVPGFNQVQMEEKLEIFS